MGTLAALVPQCPYLHRVTLSAAPGQIDECLTLLCDASSLETLEIDIYTCGEATCAGNALERLDSRLRSLALQGRGAETIQLLRQLSALTCLTSLTVSRCGRFRDATAGFSRLTALSSLKLQRCSGLTTALGQLSSLVSLRELDLGQSVSAQPLKLAALSGLTALTRLGLQSANLQPVPAGRLHLPALKVLKVLICARDTHGQSSMRLFAAPPEGLRELAIDWLDACRDRFSAFRVLRTPWGSQLRKLTLWGWAARDIAAIAIELAALPLLETLVLCGFSTMTDEHAARLGSLPELRHIVFAQCPCLSPAAVQRSLTLCPSKFIFKIRSRGGSDHSS